MASVRIVDDSGTLKASPAAVTVDQGETVSWQALEGHTISVWFPCEGVFSPSLGVLLDPSGASVRADAPITMGQDGIEYCIYDHTDNQFVVGNSHPVMIIKGGGK